MSRVAIRDLYMDIADNCCDYTDEKFDILVDTEIVPRKIVEKIIAYCEEEKKLFSSDDEYDECASTMVTMATNVIEYAEDLLKEFEKNKNEINN